MPKELMSQEPYTTSTGTNVLLTRLADEHARGVWPAEFWTWRYEDGWGPGIGSLSDRHLTREAAIERLEATERIEILAGAYEDYYNRPPGLTSRIRRNSHHQSSSRLAMRT